MVGNSGAAEERLNVVTASARSFPSRARGKPTDIGKNIIVTRFVGNVPDVDPRHGLEQLRGDVRDAAAAAGGEHERAWLRFGQGNQLLDALRGHAVVHAEHDRRHGNLRHRREILHRVDRQLVEAGIDDKLRIGQESERVAVRGCFRYAFCCDIAARAGSVVDHDRLRQCLGELLAEQARDDVRATAGRETHHDADRLFGITRLRNRMTR
jgi:hypothetical protein